MIYSACIRYWRQFRNRVVCKSAIYILKETPYMLYCYYLHTLF